MLLFWAIEMEGKWFCMKHNCWCSHLDRKCIFDTKEAAVFFYDRWLTDEQKRKAKLVPFELKNV